MKKVRKIKPISPDLTKEWKESKRKISQLENKIIQRVDYILNFWFKTYNETLPDWWFERSLRIEGKEIIGLDIPYTNVELPIIDKFGIELSPDYSIPARWLYEDFEEEISKGRQLYLAKINDEEINKKLISSAKKKLSKEEYQALNDEEINKKLISSAKKKLSKEEYQALKNQ